MVPPPRYLYTFQPGFISEVAIVIPLVDQLHVILSSQFGFAALLLESEHAVWKVESD